MKTQLSKLLTLCITLLLSHSNFSQSANWIWAKTVQSSTTLLSESKICSINSNQTIYSGNYFNSITIGTTTHTMASGQKGGIIIKYDASGMPMWSKNFGPFYHPSSGGYTAIVDVETNSLGEIFALGSFSTSITFDGNTLNGTGKISMYLLKLDANGNYIWGKAFTSGQRVLPKDLHIDNNGIYVTGMFTGSQMTLGTYTLANNMTANGTEYEDFFITKLDLNGNTLWANKNVSFQGGREIGKAVTTNTLGEVYVAGEMRDGGVTTFGTYTLSSPSGSAGEDAFIVKYDSNGNAMWANKVGSSNIDYVAGLVIDNTGNPTLVGSYYGTIFSASTNTITNSGSSTSDVYALNINPSGSYNWLKKVTNGTGDDLAADVAIDNNNNVSIIGKFSSGSITAGGSTLSPAGGTDMFLIKLNSAGNDVLGVSAGAMFLDDGTSVAVDSNNDVYVTGQYAFNVIFGSLPALSGGFSATNYIAKLSDAVPTGINNFIDAQTLSFKVSPNPANQSIYIQGVNFNDGVQVKIMSIDGKIMKDEMINQSIFNISDLNTGMYFMELTDSSGKTGVAKFIKE